MDEQSYFVKVRGRVIGPFLHARLKQMASRGQLSRVNQISIDRINWQSASDFPQLFLEPVPAQSESSAGTQPVEAKAGPQNQIKQHTEGSTQQNQWHYGINDQTSGPISPSALIDLIRKGQLSATDVVWQSGMEDWMELRMVPELLQYVPGAARNLDPQQPSKRDSDSGNLEVQDRTINQTSLKFIPVIRLAIPWIYFLLILLYISAATGFIGFFVTLVLGARTDSANLIFQALGSLFQALTFFTAGFLLQRYASNCNRYVLAKDSSALLEALTWLGRFWIFVASVFILIIFLIVIIFVYFSALLPSV